VTCGRVNPNPHCSPLCLPELRRLLAEFSRASHPLAPQEGRTVWPSGGKEAGRTGKGTMTENIVDPGRALFC